MSATETIGTHRASLQDRPGGVPPRGRGQPERLRDGLAIALPTLLGVALCLYELTTRSLWLDESATVAIASQHGAAFGSALAHDGGNMLGYYALMHVLIGWFGHGALVIRIPSVVFAAATVTLTGALGLRLFGRRGAVLAGVLTAVSLSLVYWGQDARGYAAMIAFVAASFLAFVALLEPGAARRPWLVYVLLTTAAIYAGLEAALVIPAQLIALAWRRERWGAALSAMAVTAICCVPLAILAAGRGSGQLFWVPPPSLRVLHQIAQALTSSGLQPSFYTSTGTALLILTLVALVAAVGSVALTARRAGIGGAEGLQGAALSVSWLLIPGVLAAAESTLGQSIFEPRYLLVSLPAVSLLLAWTLLEGRLPPPLVYPATAALIVLRLLALAPAYGVSSENWRGATAYVVSHAQPRDCIAFYPSDNRQAFRYYLASPAPAAAPRPILPALPWSRVRPFVEDYSSLSPSAVAKLPARCGRVWLVASHEGRVGGPPVSQANYRRFTNLTSGLRRLYPQLRSAGFGAQRVVTVALYSR